MLDRKKKYYTYLKSKTWGILREQRLALDHYRCVMCNADATQVHHRKYPIKLGTESIFDLASVCSLCHKRHHETYPKYYTLSEAPELHIRRIRAKLNE